MAKQVYKGATNRGRLIGLTRANGEWLAVVQTLSTDRGSDPILAGFMPVTELKGSAKRKAARWLERLA